MDKVEIALFTVIAIAVIALAYILLTTYIFSSANNGEGGGFGVAVKTGPVGCISTSGNCPQPGSTGSGQVLINGS